MKKSNISIPILITLFLVLSSFIPIIQVMILTLNGGLASITEKLFSINSIKTAVVFNAVVSVICLLWYYKQGKLGLEILSAIISVFFLFPYFTFQIGDYIKSEDYYFLTLMLSGFLTGLVLLIIGFIKKR